MRVRVGGEVGGAGGRGLFVEWLAISSSKLPGCVASPLVPSGARAGVEEAVSFNLLQE